MRNFWRYWSLIVGLAASGCAVGGEESAIERPLAAFSNELGNDRGMPPPPRELKNRKKRGYNLNEGETATTTPVQSESFAPPAENQAQVTSEFGGWTKQDDGSFVGQRTYSDGRTTYHRAVSNGQGSFNMSAFNDQEMASSNFIGGHVVKSVPAGQKFADGSAADKGWYAVPIGYKQDAEGQDVNALFESTNTNFGRMAATSGSFAPGTDSDWWKYNRLNNPEHQYHNKIVFQHPSGSQASNEQLRTMYANAQKFDPTGTKGQSQWDVFNTAGIDYAKLQAAEHQAYQANQSQLSSFHDWLAQTTNSRTDLNPAATIATSSGEDFTVRNNQLVIGDNRWFVGADGKFRNAALREDFHNRYGYGMQQFISAQ